MLTVEVCPICNGQDRQLAHGCCARECRDASGVIPPMTTITVVPVDEHPGPSPVSLRHPDGAEIQLVMPMPAALAGQTIVALGELGYEFVRQTGADAGAP